MREREGNQEQVVCDQQQRAGKLTGLGTAPLLHRLARVLVIPAPPATSQPLAQDSPHRIAGGPASGNSHSPPSHRP